MQTDINLDKELKEQWEKHNVKGGDKMKVAYKKAPTYIVEENITLKEFRNKYSADYKPAWIAANDELGYALTNKPDKKDIWWVGNYFFNENYKIKE